MGKEVFAEELHRHSPRAGQPLLRLNCGGLGEALFESELFGHEKGACTGAVRAKTRAARDRPTAFLDEIASAG